MPDASRRATSPSDRSAEGLDPVHAAIASGGQQLDPLASLGPDEPFGARHGSHGDACLGGSLSQEGNHWTEPGIAVLNPNRPGVHQYEVRTAQHDCLMQPCGVVVEEGERAIEPGLDRIGQLVVASEAVHEHVM